MHMQHPILVATAAMGSDRQLARAAENGGTEPFLFDAALCSNVGCLHSVDFHLFSFAEGCSEAKFHRTEAAVLREEPPTGGNLMSFLKTLTCQRNKPEAQIAKLVSHTAYQSRSTERDQEMKKTLISSVTAFAIVLSAGMAMAGPVRDHGQRGHAHHVRSTVSQAFNHADKMTKTHQSTNMADRSFDVTSKQDLGQTNLSSTQQRIKPYSASLDRLGTGSRTWMQLCIHCSAFECGDFCPAPPPFIRLR